MPKRCSVLAISGGVDSVVLLDMVMNGNLYSTFHPGSEPKGVVVAHFDHGIRPESHRDAEFVQNLAAKYGLEFILGRAKLGLHTSEETARQKRYDFLRGAARDDTVKIITAHHQDDLIETILINLIRGTGWRGLAPMWSSDVARPLVGLSKAEIVAYAINNNLEWIEDETNYSSKYFRNRVRDLPARLTPKQRQGLLDLNQKQIKIRGEIEGLLNDHVKVRSLRQSELQKWPEDVAIEVLRQTTDGKLTTPQLRRLTRSLQTGKSGDRLQPGGGLQIGLYRDQVTISEL